MFEITLPCCDAPTVLETGASEVRCDACALAHVLAPDARDSRTADRPETLPLAAAA